MKITQEHADLLLILSEHPLVYWSVPQMCLLLKKDIVRTVSLLVDLLFEGMVDWIFTEHGKYYKTTEKGDRELVHLIYTQKINTKISYRVADALWGSKKWMSALK